MDFFDPNVLSQWLSVHPHWIMACIGLIAFVESLAIAGIVVPGVAFLFGVATIAGVSNTPVLLCLGCAAIGAIMGDVLSFLLGYKYQREILSAWPVKNYPEAMKKGERFFQKYGLYSVVIGRFVGPIRPVLPLVAGIMNMNPAKFVAINVLSAMAWAPAYVLPGYWAGSAI